MEISRGGVKFQIKCSNKMALVTEFHGRYFLTGVKKEDLNGLDYSRAKMIAA